MGCFRVDLLQFFTKKCLNLAFAWKAGNLLSNPRILGNFFKFSNFLWNVLELICSNFLPKNDKILLLVGPLGTRHETKGFQEFFWNFLIFCAMFQSWVSHNVYQKTTKYGYWADCWELAIKSTHFKRVFFNFSNFR